MYRSWPKFNYNCQLPLSYVRLFGHWHLCPYGEKKRCHHHSAIPYNKMKDTTYFKQKSISKDLITHQYFNTDQYFFQDCNNDVTLKVSISISFPKTNQRKLVAFYKIFACTAFRGNLWRHFIEFNCCESYPVFNL